MRYVDVQYISVARKNEVDHHEHTMKILRAQVAHITRSVAWELEQHHSRLKELQQVEDTLAIDKSSRPAINPFIVEPVPPSQLEDTPSMETSPIPAMNTQPTPEPVPSSRRRRTKTKKKTERTTQEPVAELVG